MKVMAKRLTITIMIFSFALLWSATSMATEVKGIDIIDYGLYKTAFARWQDAPNTRRGEIEIVSAKELIKRTKIIPANIGDEYDLRFLLTGLGVNEILDSGWDPIGAADFTDTGRITITGGVIPEPGSMTMLIGLGVTSLVFYRRRRRRRRGSQ